MPKPAEIIDKPLLAQELTALVAEAVRVVLSEPDPQRRRYILTLTEVSLATNLKPREINELVAAGSFPKPVRISAKQRGWIHGEVVDWIASRPRDDDKKEGA